MTITEKQVEAGQAVYSKAMLSIYDWFVLGFSNRLIWRCPSTHILALYNQHVTTLHLRRECNPFDLKAQEGVILGSGRHGIHPSLARSLSFTIQGVALAA